jgi:hypothetical protein
MGPITFLLDKGILTEGNSKWIVTFESGQEVDIVELLGEYHQAMNQYERNR